MKLSSIRGNSQRMPVDERFKKGIELFNQEQFYECHEILEELWLESTGPYRNLYKGVIQAAVALFHLKRGNLNGARALFQTSAAYLTEYKPRALGLNVEILIEGMNLCFRGRKKLPIPKLDFHEP